MVAGTSPSARRRAGADGAEASAPVPVVAPQARPYPGKQCGAAPAWPPRPAPAAGKQASRPGKWAAAAWTVAGANWSVSGVRSASPDHPAPPLHRPAFRRPAGGQDPLLVGLRPSSREGIPSLFLALRCLRPREYLRASAERPIARALAVRARRPLRVVPGIFSLRSYFYNAGRSSIVPLLVLLLTFDQHHPLASMDHLILLVEDADLHRDVATAKPG